MLLKHINNIYSFSFTQNKRVSDRSNDKQKYVYFKILAIDSLHYYQQAFYQNSTVEIIFTVANEQMYEEIKEVISIFNRLLFIKFEYIIFFED